MNKLFKNKAGNIVLELRQETSSAWLTIMKSGKLVDENDILDLIDAAGIKTGFDEAIRLIRERGYEKEYDVPFPIAICSMTDEKREARLVYHFDQQTRLSPNETIPFSELEKLTYYNAGDVIAAYSDNIFEQGGSIYDIFGELITPPTIDNEEAQCLVGPNVRYESREYYAEKTGYPYLDDQGRICILDSIRIDAECCNQMDTLRTPLTLHVLGDLNGCNIASASDITVSGNVISSSIYCEKNLMIDGDIRTCTNPGIQALGELHVSTILNSRVLVKDSIRFSGSLSDSTIACDGDIQGSGDAAKIVGGLVQSGGNIDVSEAGADFGAETEIEIAISPFYRALLLQMTKELLRVRQESDESAIDDLQKRIKRCETELDNQLNLFLQRAEDQKKSICVRGAVFPKTMLRVLKHTYPIKTTQSGICLIEKD